MKAPKHRVQGNATVEVIVSLLALSPFLIGIPLLGKQLDIKHKAYDAARYSVWERTVWSNRNAGNPKADEDIFLESRDRMLGDPTAGVLHVGALRELGVGENALWRDATNRRIVSHENGRARVHLTLDERSSPVEVGHWFALGIAHGGGPIGQIAEVLQVRHLNLNRYGLVDASASVGLRPILSNAARRSPSLGVAIEAGPDERQLVQQANAAILSDTWSSRDESMLRRRVDDVTANELIEELERPGRVIGLQARGKGEPLYGEGQYGWEPDLRPRSTTLPAAYIRRR